MIQNYISKQTILKTATICCLWMANQAWGTSDNFASNNYPTKKTITTKYKKAKPLTPNRLTSSFLYIGNWSAPKPSRNGRIANLVSAPRLLIDEDFTDGAFNNLGAGANGKNWRMSKNQGVDFMPPNNRNFVQALSRLPSQGTEGWAGATWAVWDDKNGNNKYNDNEMQKFYIDKKDEVCVLKFRSFSDIARKPETYGVEVAMMEWSDTLAGYPHYWHDLSFEAVHIMHVDKLQVPTQLTGNMENIENRQPYGVKYAHFTSNGGFPTNAELSKEYNNLVIWRNLPGTGKTNVEQWGELTGEDYTVDHEMKNDLDPDNSKAIIDHIQLTMYRSPMVTSNPFLIRDNIIPQDAQVGIMNVHVGITKKSDFNLDYKIDSLDADILVKNWGVIDNTTTNSKTTIQTGDATNDKQIDINDASPLVAFWTGATANGPTPTAKASYNPATGEIKLSGQNISFIKLSSSIGTFKQNQLDLSGLDSAAVFRTDSTIGFFTTGAWNLTEKSLGNIALANLNGKNLTMTVNYKGSNVAEGFKVALDGTVFTDVEKNGINEAQQLLSVDKQHWNIPASAQNIAVSIYNSNGQLLWSKEGSPENIAAQQINLPAGFKILRVKDKSNNRNLLEKKYVTY